VIQDCVGAALGPGLAYDDAGNVIRARISTDTGNAMVIGGDGGLYAAGGGGGGLTTVAVQDTPCIDLGGLGTVPQPLTATPILNSAAGNLVTCTPTGLRAALTTGACGLTGNGSAASPLAARVRPWPYTCPVDANAGGVYCDTTGTLRSEPRGRALTFSFTEQRNYANLAVPAGQDVVIDSFETNVTNPDPCREAVLIVERELDVDFVLPAGAGAAYGHSTDEMVYHRNTGSSTETDFHVQTTKVFGLAAPLAAGASSALTFDVTLGRGSGGATWNRVQVFIRTFMFIL
jgi:hypothetical protein